MRAAATSNHLVGCEPYVNGYVYPSGALALGSRCFAPVVEIKNTLPLPVLLSYESRLVQLGAAEDVLANRQILAPKSSTLITNLQPSLPDAPSHIRVEDASGNLECFLLEHDLEGGYGVRHLREEGRAPPVLSLTARGEPYSIIFGGRVCSSLENKVILPLRLHYAS